MRSDQTCGEEPGAPTRGTHHVPEVGAQRPRGLVVLHDAVVVEDFPAALTAAEIRQALRPLRAPMASVSTRSGGCESRLILKESDFLHMKTG